VEGKKKKKERISDPKEVKNIILQKNTGIRIIKIEKVNYSCTFISIVSLKNLNYRENPSK
jgi:hypothetical protein